jgi:heme-degrading monooxygenase HmoA
MAVGVSSTVAGMTDEAYDQMAQYLLPKIKEQPGFVLHISGPIDGGYRVIEVWESEEDQTRWIEEQVKPAGQQAGVTIPSSEFFPVSNTVTK